MEGGFWCEVSKFCSGSMTLLLRAAPSFLHNTFLLLFLFNLLIGTEARLSIMQLLKLNDPSIRNDSLHKGIYSYIQLCSHVFYISVA